MIRFERIPIHTTTAESEREAPYLDIMGEIEPIEFLFTQGDKYHYIARANLHTLKGEPKTGKSAAGLALITAAIKGEYLGIKAMPDIKVLWIDTEQDKSTLCQKARAVLDMAGVDAVPENLKVVPLRGYGSPAECLADTIKKIEDNAPDFVFLDGIVDLCGGFNDEEKSREAVGQLEAAAEHTGAAILCLIHTNGRKDDKARGHLGTILQQKSAEIYQIEKGQFHSDNVSKVVGKVIQPFSRFASVPGFAFAFEDDFKISDVSEAMKKAEQKKKDEAEEEKREEFRSIFAALFKNADKIRRKDLIKAYTEECKCGDTTARNAIDYADAAHILYKHETKGKKAYYSYLFPGFEDIKENDNKDDEDL